jgi:ATP-dependent 26S proteasome regulatory subunit
MPTKSQTQAADISALLRARNPLLWVITREEARAERYLIEAAASAGYATKTWDVAQGIADISGVVEQADRADPDAILGEITARATGKAPGGRTLWILRDLAPWLSGPGGVSTQRRLRNLARLLPGVGLDRAQAIVVLSAGGDVPPELAGHTTVIDWPLPDRAEIADILDAAIASLPADLAKQAINGNRDAAIDAATGLTGEEAAACYARSLVQLRKIDVKTIANEKKRVIARERVLEWHDPLPGGLEQVGGLDNLKTWLKGRAKAYSPAAREFGLPAPKGALLVGVPGCGKTLFAKACATARNVPLLRWDIGALKSKFVGESETNLRKAFKTIEAIGPCVVLIDEIEKALQGATSGSADGGVSADALGAILSWMQDRTGDAFVIATANDVASLPPELLRKGRFDEVWFIDLPNPTERVAVLEAALRARGRDPKTLGLDWSALTAITEGFTGSEIDSLVPDALFVAFDQGAREITTEDLLAAASTVAPLSRMADGKITKLREWAQGRARPASASQKASERPVAARVLDVA